VDLPARVGATFLAVGLECLFAGWVVLDQADRVEAGLVKAKRESSRTGKQLDAT
jgi:hypothetical protein